ncbi:response regulator [Alishewanella longhuensis]
MKKIGLRFWLILCSVLPALLVALLLGSYFNSKQQQDSEQHLREKAANIALSLAITSQQLLQQQQLAAIQTLLEHAHRLNSPMVISISLFNTQGELLLTSNSQHDLSQETLHQQHVKPNQLNYLDQQQHLLVYQPLLKSNPLRDDVSWLSVNTLSPNLREALLSSGASACLPKPAHMRKLAMSIAFPYSQHSEQPAEPANAALYPLKVLTVDDNEANLKLINTLLRERVQSLDSARDGAEAWQKTTQHVYDIIFMDINMPVMDGITACQRIRQSSLNEQTPVIAVTAHAMDGERARLISLGFSEFLTKPLDEKMLHYTLQEFCQIQKNSQNVANPAPEAVPLIDWPLALQRAAGKPELAQEMLLLLIKSLPQSDKQIRQAITDNDQQVLLHALHKLHGACCYTGVPRLKNLLEALETQLKKGASIKLLEPELYELDDVIQMLLEADTSMPEQLVQASSITVAQA